jgi:hypothetical protein
MTPRERKPVLSTGTLVVAAIAAVAVVAAWQVGKRSERRAAEALLQRALPAAMPSPSAPTPAPTQDAAAAPEGGEIPVESSATFDMPLGPAGPEPVAPPYYPTARPYFPPEDDRPLDTPARCVMVHASPSMTSAYGRTGAVVQLVVRAHNGCPRSFGSVTFRAIAIGADGNEAGAAVGSFPGGVPAGGSAETLIAVPTRPSTSLSYRAEIY